jgi:hypothetical protein
MPLILMLQAAVFHGIACCVAHLYFQCNEKQLVGNNNHIFIRCLTKQTYITNFAIALTQRSPRLSVRGM